MAAKKSLSEHNLVAPYKLIGSTALSVDRAITFLTFLSIDASIIFCAPITFVLINSNGLYSAAGTCLRAAACTTISISFNANSNLVLSLISPRKYLRDLYFLKNGSFDISYCFSSSLEKITNLLIS